MLLLDLPGLERGEAREPQVEDGLRLLLRELELRHQAVACALGVRGVADQLDHRVDVAQREEESLEDVRARLGLAELVLRAPHHDLALVLHVRVDDPRERQRARHAIHERDHVRAERGLHRRVLVELVEHDLRDRVALQLDHQADA